MTNCSLQELPFQFLLALCRPLCLFHILGYVSLHHITSYFPQLHWVRGFNMNKQKTSEIKSNIIQTLFKHCNSPISHISHDINNVVYAL